MYVFFFWCKQSNYHVSIECIKEIEELIFVFTPVKIRYIFLYINFGLPENYLATYATILYNRVNIVSVGNIEIYFLIKEKPSHYVRLCYTSFNKKKYARNCWCYKVKRNYVWVSWKIYTWQILLFPRNYDNLAFIHYVI